MLCSVLPSAKGPVAIGGWVPLLLRNCAPGERRAAGTGWGSVSCSGIQY